MKVLKNVTCSSKKYRVVFDPKLRGGMFEVEKKEIRVGSVGSPQDIMESLLHEIAEVT